MPKGREKLLLRFRDSNDFIVIWLHDGGTTTNSWTIHFDFLQLKFSWRIRSCCFASRKRLNQKQKNKAEFIALPKFWLHTKEKRNQKKFSGKLLCCWTNMSLYHKTFSHGNENASAMQFVEDEENQKEAKRFGSKRFPRRFLGFQFYERALIRIDFLFQERLFSVIVYIK